MIGEEYYLRRIDRTNWQVAKFIGTQLPVAIYRVKWNPASPFKGYCTCYGFHHAVGHCRHLEMVASWWRKGCPIPLVLTPRRLKTLYFSHRGTLKREMEEL